MVSTQPKGFPWWLSGKEPTCQSRDTGSISGAGIPRGEGNGKPLLYSCLVILWTKELGVPWSTRSQRIGHDLATEQQTQQISVEYIDIAVVVQLLGSLQLFVTPWTGLHYLPEFNQTHVGLACQE